MALTFTPVCAAALLVAACVGPAEGGEIKAVRLGKCEARRGWEASGASEASVTLEFPKNECVMLDYEAAWKTGLFNDDYDWPNPGIWALKAHLGYDMPPHVMAPFTGVFSMKMDVDANGWWSMAFWPYPDCNDAVLGGPLFTIPPTAAGQCGRAAAGVATLGGAPFPSRLLSTAVVAVQRAGDPWVARAPARRPTTAPLNGTVSAIALSSVGLTATARNVAVLPVACTDNGYVDYDVNGSCGSMRHPSFSGARVQTTFFEDAAYLVVGRAAEAGCNVTRDGRSAVVLEFPPALLPSSDPRSCWNIAGTAALYAKNLSQSLRVVVSMQAGLIDRDLSERPGQGQASPAGGGGGLSGGVIAGIIVGVLVVVAMTVALYYYLQPKGVTEPATEPAKTFVVSSPQGSTPGGVHMYPQQGTAYPPSAPPLSSPYGYPVKTRPESV